MAFDEPDETGNGVRLYPKDILGHLLLVWAVEYIAHSPTAYTQPGKPSDVVVVDVVDLDQADPDTQLMGLLGRCTWWRQAQLIKMLRPKVGGVSPLLVRMSKGGATVGRTAPFILVSQTQDPAAVSRANTWLSGHADYIPSQPQPRLEIPEDDGRDPWAGQADAALPPPAPPRQQVPPVSAPVAQETMLERMARQAQSQQKAVDRMQGLEYRGPSGDGPIPF